MNGTSGDVPMATRQEFLALAEQVEKLCWAVSGLAGSADAKPKVTGVAVAVNKLREQSRSGNRECLIRWLEGKLKTTVQKSPDGDYLLGTLLGEPIRTDDYLVALVFAWTHESYWSRSWNPPLKRSQL